MSTIHKFHIEDGDLVYSDGSDGKIVMGTRRPSSARSSAPNSRRKTTSALTSRPSRTFTSASPDTTSPVAR